MSTARKRNKLKACGQGLCERGKTLQMKQVENLVLIACTLSDLGSGMECTEGEKNNCLG